MARVIVDRSSPLVVFRRGHQGTEKVINNSAGPLAILHRNSNGLAKIVMGNDAANSARFARISEFSAEKAEESAAYAEEFSGPAYETVAAGEAATTAGQFFRVSNGDTPRTYTRYQRTAGGSVVAASLATTIDLASTSAGKGVDLVSRSAYPVPTRTALKALDTTRFQSAILRETRRAGVFNWTLGDFSALIAADTQEGIYIKADGVDASVGAWVRDYHGWINVRWFGAVADGLTLDSTACQCASDVAALLGGKYLFAPAGSYVVNFSLDSNCGLIGEGSGQYDATPADAITRFIRAPGAARAIALKQDSQRHYLARFRVDGAGGRAANSGDCIVGRGNDYGIVDDVTCIDGRYGFDGHGSDPAGVFFFINSTMRGCRSGMRGFRDSTLLNVTISGNYETGWYNNHGNNTALGCYIEWNRDQANLTNGVPNSAHGIYCDSNSTETVIDSCKFDRNAGNDIFLASGAQCVTIGANQYRGSGWGGNLSKTQRVPIFCSGAVDQLSIADGQAVEFRNHGPSSIKGPYTPLGFAVLSSSKRVNIGMVNGTFGSTLDTNSASLDLIWKASAVVGEWYLALDSQATVVSPIVQPDAMSIGGTLLTAGTIGSLAAGQWAWGNNDALGYSTVYVRSSGTADPNGLSDVIAGYDVPVNSDAAVVDYQTPRHRDRAVVTIPAATTTAVKLRSRRRMSATGRDRFKLILSGFQTTSAAHGEYIFPFLIRRDSGSSAITVVQGNVQAMVTAASTFTMGWATAATDDILVTVTSVPGGGEFTVSINNTDATRAANLVVELEW